MDLSHGVGARHAEEVVATDEIGGVVGEAFAAEVGLGQTAALDLRGHGPIEDEDPVAETVTELGCGGKGLSHRSGNACRN